MGRRSATTAEKIRKGYQPSWRNQKEPKYQRTVSLDPPDGLRAEGLAEWTRVAPVMAQARVLTDADISQLEDYCFRLTDLRAAERAFRKKTLAEAIKTGEFGAMIRLQEQVHKLRIQLGLTPASRAGLKVEPDHEAEETPTPTGQYLRAVQK